MAEVLVVWIVLAVLAVFRFLAVPNFGLPTFLVRLEKFGAISASFAIGARAFAVVRNFSWLQWSAAAKIWIGSRWV